MSQAIHTAGSGPVIGNEDCVRTNRLHHYGANREIVAASGNRNPISVFNIVLLGKARMNLGSWFRILVY